MSRASDTFFNSIKAITLMVRKAPSWGDISNPLLMESKASSNFCWFINGTALLLSVSASIGLFPIALSKCEIA